MTATSPTSESIQSGLITLRPRTAAELWDASVAIARARWVPLICLSALLLLVMTPATLARAFLFDASEHELLDFLGSVYAFAVGSVVVGAMTIVVADAWHGRPADVARAGREAMRHAVALMVAGVVTSLLVLVGTIFLVVPGLIAASRFFAVGTVIVLEEQAIRGAFRRSVQLSRGNMRRLLATVGVATLVSFAFSFALQLLLTRLGFSASTTELLMGLFNVPLAPFFLAVSVVAYFDARVRHDAYDLEVAVEALG